MNKTLDQKRAAHAWESIRRLKVGDGYPDSAQEYGREAKKLPMRIMASGLGQALAFIRAKKRADILYENLNSWIVNHQKLSVSNKDDLIEAIVNGDSTFLRRATDESLAYLQWITRFAEAEGLTKDMEEK